MAKYYGAIGYGTSVEKSPGVWEDEITEIKYFGDVLRNTKINQNDASKLNEDINVENRISILADEFAVENFEKIKYIRWAGGLRTVSSVEVQTPRLILTIGRVYNGPTP